MNAFKPGLLDVAVLAILAIVLLLPAPQMQAKNGLSLKSQEVLELGNRSQAEFALLQARHYGMGKAQKGSYMAKSAFTTELVDTLVDYGHLDQAIRVASEDIQIEGPLKWRRHLTYSGAFTERFAVERAMEQALLAQEHCLSKVSKCRLDQKSKIELFIQDLKAAEKALEKGLDPQKDSDAFVEEMNKHKTRIRLPNVSL